MSNNPVFNNGLKPNHQEHSKALGLAQGCDNLGSKQGPHLMDSLRVSGYLSGQAASSAALTCSAVVIM